MHKLFTFCFLYIVPGIVTIKVYLFKVNNDKETNLLSNQFKEFLLGRMTHKLRSEYKFNAAKNICNRHFGSIYGTKAQKSFCLENFEKRQLQNEPFKRKRKPIIQPKPFIDMTRGVVSKPYSSDYIDFKDNRNINEFSNDYLDVGDLVRYDYGTRRATPYEIQLHKTKGKFTAEDYDTSSDERSDENQNRYQIIDESSESESASSESESGSKEAKVAKLIYFQGRNRHVKDNDGRKRLQHFLPKRFHWERDDIKKLGYYWFNGPRGRFAEAVNLL